MEKLWNKSPKTSGDITGHSKLKISKEIDLISFMRHDGVTHSFQLRITYAVENN